jgi:hypothetical protein
LEVSTQKVNMIEKSRRKSAETRAIDTPPAGRVGVHDTNYGLSSLYILCGCLFTEAQIPMIEKSRRKSAKTRAIPAG